MRGCGEHTQCAGDIDASPLRTRLTILMQNLVDLAVELVERAARCWPHCAASPRNTCLANSSPRGEHSDIRGGGQDRSGRPPCSTAGLSYRPPTMKTGAIVRVGGSGKGR